MEIEIKKRGGDAFLEKFAAQLIEVSEKIGFPLSSRGWCYQLEGFRLINKGQFDYVQTLINRARKRGFLPIDFIAVDKTRTFDLVEMLDSETPAEFLKDWLETFKRVHKLYDAVSFWEGQKYYCQMLVEKIDLKTLNTHEKTGQICQKYHIPIATTRGWADINQRVDMANRFKESEERGMMPVLLYEGDFDVFGCLISDKLKKNLKDIERATGWSPDNLIVDRFGLNYDQIEEAGLTWIEGNDFWITGSGKRLDPNHPAVKEWLKKYGPRKVEANAIVVKPDFAREIAEKAIRKYLSEDALERFEQAKGKMQGKVERLGQKIELGREMDKLLKKLKKSG